MAEFKRSRLERKSDEQITKKTVILGIFTILLFIGVVVFGLPLLVRFSIFLGNAKSQKDSLTKENVLPPLPPRLVLPFEATNSSKINVSGFAEANVDVELTKNNMSVGKTKVSETGDFVFKVIELTDGDNVFSATAMTDEGGSSESSKSETVTYDTTTPSLEMTNPSEESLSVDVADFDIVGKSEKGVSVMVNNRVAMVDDQGNFKIKLQLNGGKNDIVVLVRDAAGNETKKNITITYNQ